MEITSKNIPKLLLTMKELQDYTGIGRNNIYKLAHSSGAVVYIGKRIFVNRKRFDEYIDSITG